MTSAVHIGSSLPPPKHIEMLMKYLKIKLNACLGLQRRKKFPEAENKENLGADITKRISQWTVCFRTGVVSLQQDIGL